MRSIMKIDKLSGTRPAACFAMILGLIAAPMADANATPGTVVAWGDNTYGQTLVPAGLSGVTAIAAGYYDTYAVKSDGTVVAWGGNYRRDGQETVVAGLSGVTAIAVGYYDVLALKSDGTVPAWGSGLTAPPGLTGVTAVAAGYYHSVALKSDGTVVAWGNNIYGQL